MRKDENSDAIHISESHIRDPVVINKSFLDSIPTKVNYNNLQNTHFSRKQYAGNDFSFSTRIFEVKS